MTKQGAYERGNAVAFPPNINTLNPTPFEYKTKLNNSTEIDNFKGFHIASVPKPIMQTYRVFIYQYLKHFGCFNTINFF